MSKWKHMRAVLLLPVMVTIVIPGFLTALTGALKVGWSLSPPLSLLPGSLGLCLIAAGLVLLAGTVRLFAAVGEGTLAPWDPTQKLVVQGVYRHVRNPMISGVFCILLGEALLLGSLPIFAWFLLFVCLNAIYIPLLEERDLERRFRQGYVVYKRHVPRWIPRREPRSGFDD
jgi:protein-S-isoprenylcysteine O-methyltransferase Ste14